MHGGLPKRKISKGRILEKTSTVAQNNEKHLVRGAFCFILWVKPTGQVVWRELFSFAEGCIK